MNQSFGWAIQKISFQTKKLFSKDSLNFLERKEWSQKSFNMPNIEDMFSTQLNGHQNNKISFIPYMQNLGTSFARFIHMFIWTKLRSLVEWRFWSSNYLSERQLVQVRVSFYTEKISLGTSWVCNFLFRILLSSMQQKNGVQRETSYIRKLKLDPMVKSIWVTFIAQEAGTKRHQGIPH